MIKYRVFDTYEVACKLLERRFADRIHHAACAIKTKRKIYLALHLDSDGIDVCAEQVALSNIIKDNIASDDVYELSSVWWSGKGNIKPEAIPPCGNCRQLLIEYVPKINIVLKVNNKLTVKSIKKLLPHAYRRPKV